MCESAFTTDATLAARRSLAQRGMASLPVQLGQTFRPSQTSAVVVQLANGSVEWFLPKGVAYLGQDDSWLATMCSPVTAGARLVHTSADLDCGLSELGSRLANQLPSPQLPIIQPKTSGTALPGECADPGDRAEAAQKDQAALLGRLTDVVFGQEHALEPLTEMVTLHRARERRRRPAVAALLGPTGVGKSAAAEQLAIALAQLHPKEAWKYLPIDCGTLTAEHTISQITGSPPGYAGHGTSQALADVIAARPHTVVLLDEIEKAHPVIFRVLLSILDTGRIMRTDSLENTVDATNCVILWTSNLGAETLVRDLNLANAWEDPSGRLAVCRQALAGAGLRPEMIGRLQVALPFRPLTDALRGQIVHKAVVNLGKDFGADVKEVDAAVIAAVLEETQDARFGARSDEHVVAALVGRAFLDVRKEDGPVAVLPGPPCHCVPVSLIDRRSSC